MPTRVLEGDLLASEFQPIELVFDAIAPNANRIPRNAWGVAGYVNGANTSYIWGKAQYALFPNATKLRINVTGSPNTGNVLDVERYDATPEDVPHWWDARHAAGEPYLIVYCERSNLDIVNAALGDRPCWRWVATLDGTMTYDHRAMIQFSNARLSGGPYDVSAVWSSNLAKMMKEHSI